MLFGDCISEEAWLVCIYTHKYIYIYIYICIRTLLVPLNRSIWSLRMGI